MKRRDRLTPRLNLQTDENRRSLPLSVILLGFAAILALFFTSWLGFFGQETEVTLEIKETKITHSGEVELTGARYRGRSPSGRPFEITAKRAKEATDGSGRIDMIRPTASITMANGSVVNLSSDNGIFDRDLDLVNMSGDVVVKHPDLQMQLKTNTLETNLKVGEMQSDVPVIVQDNNRRIDADNMKVYDNGSRIVFGGLVRMVIKRATAFPGEEPGPKT